MAKKRAVASKELAIGWALMTPNGRPYIRAGVFYNICLRRHQAQSTRDAMEALGVHVEVHRVAIIDRGA